MGLNMKPRSPPCAPRWARQPLKRHAPGGGRCRARRLARWRWRGEIGPQPTSQPRSLLFFTALTVLVGAQLLRVLLPSLTWYWGATLGRSTAVAGGAFAPVALAWFAPWLTRRIGLRRMLLALGIGLAATRLVEQFSVQANVDTWATLLGTTAWMGLLPLLWVRTRAEGEAGPQAFGQGLLLGLACDTALRGLTGTLDLSWLPGAGPALAVVGLSTAFCLALWQVTARPIHRSEE